MADKVGHQAIYLSGGGVANASFGLPDLGMTTMNDVVEDAHRICGATELPLLVDIDTGWGGAFNIARTVKEMQRAGVAAVHMEDQVAQSVVDTARIKRLFPNGRWSTVSKPPPMPRSTPTSISLPAPMRSKKRALTPPLNAPMPVWKRGGCHLCRSGAHPG